MQDMTGRKLSMLLAMPNFFVSKNRNKYLRYTGHAGVCFFLLGLIIQAGAVMPALCLSLSVTTLMFVSEPRNDFRVAYLSTASLLLFTLFFALSIMASDSISRSLFLSAPIIYGVLLYLLVIFVFKTGDCAAVFTYLSLSALLISAILLITSATHSELNQSELVKLSKIPYLVTPNDTILLSVIAPISFSALFYPWYNRVISVLGDCRI